MNGELFSFTVIFVFLMNAALLYRNRKGKRSDLSEYYTMDSIETYSVVSAGVMLIAALGELFLFLAGTGIVGWGQVMCIHPLNAWIAKVIFLIPVGMLQLFVHSLVLKNKPER